MKAELEKENLITYFDSVGNLFGRLEGTDPSGGIILTVSVDSLAKNAEMKLGFHNGWMSNLLPWIGK
ncbi:hypothetical protein AAEY33_05265 [Peribacillus simplex]|uniref:hypothetical protein n=1 Tax=Peribacillus simplex TaxID=1478 RepID=UPI003262DEF3